MNPLAVPSPDLLVEERCDADHIGRLLQRLRSPAVFCESSVAWSDLVRVTLGEHVSVRYFVVSRKAAPVAVAVVFVVRRLDATAYLSGRLGLWLRQVTQLGWNPLCFPVAYVEVPMTPRPGLFLSPELDTDGHHAALVALLEHLRRHVSARAVCVKVDDSLPFDKEFLRRRGLFSVPFLDNTWLELLPGGFEEFVTTRSANRREQIHRDIRRFSRVGGTVERCTDTRALGADLLCLYRQVERRAEERGGPPQPYPLNEAFFAAVSSVPGCTALLARVAGHLVGFLVVVKAGQAMFVRQCGLDYRTLGDTRAYFNLFYEGIRLATEQGCSAVDLGTTSYTFKERLGCTRQQARYIVNLRSALLRPLVARLAFGP